MDTQRFIILFCMFEVFLNKKFTEIRCIPVGWETFHVVLQWIMSKQEECAGNTHTPGLPEWCLLETLVERQNSRREARALWDSTQDSERGGPALGP